MSFRLVENGWDNELAAALRADSSRLRIVCPFIKKRALERLLVLARPRAIQVITRFNLGDFSEGVSDISALRVLLKHGAQVRGVRNLHAKLYLFGNSRVVVTSANLTEAALRKNHEFGFVADEPSITARCSQYFDDLWQRAGQDLKPVQLDRWEAKVSAHLAAGAHKVAPSGLGDEGTDVGTGAEFSMPAVWAGDAEQAFVKFLGEGNNRAPLSKTILEEVKRSGCHWALGYPKTKRPRRVQDGDLMFIGRLTAAPDDMRVFGRAVGMRHVKGRDDATPKDIAVRKWKAKWSTYVRVHHAEFVAGSLQNGVSLNELMDSLKANAFAATMRNLARQKGNVDPRKAYRQQAAVELSVQGRAWLNDRLEQTFARHGKLAPAQFAALDWPAVPAMKRGRNA